MLSFSQYLLEADGLGSFFLVKLPGFKLLHCLLHGERAHLHPLLQGDELPLTRGLHASIGIVGTAEHSLWDRPHWC